MSVIGGAVRGVGQAVSRVATTTAAAAGAVGGAAVNGVIGGVTGAAEGVKKGMSSGSHSAPAAAVAFGALGVAGLVEWPVLLAVGGSALLLQRLSRKEEPANSAAKASLKAVPVEPAPAEGRATESGQQVDGQEGGWPPGRVHRVAQHQLTGTVRKLLSIATRIRRSMPLRAVSDGPPGDNRRSSRPASTSPRFRCARARGRSPATCPKKYQNAEPTVLARRGARLDRGARTGRRRGRRNSDARCSTQSWPTPASPRPA